MASPLQTVKTRFGSKEALVDKVAPLLDRRPEETEAELRERLLRVSNKKLLRLLDRAEDFGARFGNREALADAITQQRAGRADADYKKKLLGHTTGRLLSLHSKG